MNQDQQLEHFADRPMLGDNSPLYRDSRRRPMPRRMQLGALRRMRVERPVWAEPVPF